MLKPALIQRDKNKKSRFISTKYMRLCDLEHDQYKTISCNIKVASVLICQNDSI